MRKLILFGFAISVALGGSYLPGACSRSTKILVEWDYEGLAVEYRIYESRSTGQWKLVQTVRGMGARPPSRSATLVQVGGGPRSYRITAVTSDGVESGPSPEGSAPVPKPPTSGSK